MCAVTIKVDGKDISCDLIINNADEFKKKYPKYFSQQAELQVECDEAEKNYKCKDYIK